MDSYTLNTVNYNYKTLSHEGFGGVCKYIATPKRVGYSRLLVKHENIQSACAMYIVLLNELRSRSKSSSPSSGEKSSHSTMVASLYK